MLLLCKVNSYAHLYYIHVPVVGSIDTIILLLPSSMVALVEMIIHFME